ncbi:MAG: hypothetical protein L3J05_04510 [Robiginitomaculum sp.]|nr:hypothetical protein [Robiginitomaculum sp.]
MVKYLSTPLVIIATFSLLGCEPKSAQAPVTTKPTPVTAPTLSAQDQFWGGLNLLCGSSYAGKMVSSDEVDADMADKEMTMTVNCTGKDIRIPFAVADNRSRTWVFSQTETGLQLSHQHNHEDGSEDKVSQYGGATATDGTATRQEFPADGFSVALFMLQDLEASMANVWAVEITPETYTYELNRSSRHFRVEFDLTKEIDTPVIPW